MNKTSARCLIILIFAAINLSYANGTAVQDVRYIESNKAFKLRDWETAYQGFRPLADEGNPDAQFKLGYLLRNGRGVEKNFPASVFWYRKAANAGHVRAQNYLAISLELGRGVEKNIQEASQWYLRAAQQDNLNAMHWMAKAHLEGNGLEQDYAEAYIWFTIARDLDMDCGRMRHGQEQAKKKMSASQLKSALQRIKTWRNNGRTGSP